MRALSSAELLHVWEQGLAQPALQRALMLLAAAVPESSVEDLAQLSIGTRDTRLLSLRELTFGSTLVSVATCAQCGERLELAFDAEDVRGSHPPAADTQALQRDGYEVTFRLPNSHDLLALADSTDAGPRALLAHCLLDCRYQDDPISVEELSDTVVVAVSECMAEADPQADVQLALTCPACTHAWRVTFDIVSFFWREIDTWARRTLQEIHLLASTYGWREADILTMSAWRRQYYLALITG